MYQVFCYLPAEHLQIVKDAVFLQGAGTLGAYRHCAWQVEGRGQFLAMEGSDPFLGAVGKLSQVDEVRLEFICPDEALDQVLTAMLTAHPYQEPAYGAIKLYNHQAKTQAVQKQTPSETSQSAINELYSLAAFYDEMNEDFVDDLAFYSDLLRGIKGPVLELGCGNSRVGRALAAQGLEVWGIDLVPEILALAAAKAEQAGLKLTLKEADMSNFSLKKEDGSLQKFAAIICPLNTLSHLQTEAELFSCFACVKKHLLPDGIFVPSVFVPHQTGLDGDGESLSCIESFYSTSANETIEVYQKSKYNPITQLKDLTWYFIGQTSEETWERSFSLRMYYPAEFRQLAKQAGLAIKEQYADYKYLPKQTESKSLDPDCIMQSIVFIVENRTQHSMPGKMGTA